MYLELAENRKQGYPWPAVTELEKQGLHKNVTVLQSRIPDTSFQWVITMDNVYGEAMQDSLLEWLLLVKRLESPCSEALKRKGFAPSRDQAKWRQEMSKYYCTNIPERHALREHAKNWHFIHSCRVLEKHSLFEPFKEYYDAFADTNNPDKRLKPDVLIHLGCMFLDAVTSALKVGDSGRYYEQWVGLMFAELFKFGVPVDPDLWTLQPANSPYAFMGAFKHLFDSNSIEAQQRVQAVLQCEITDEVHQGMESILFKLVEKEHKSPGKSTMATLAAHGDARRREGLRSISAEMAACKPRNVAQWIVTTAYALSKDFEFGSDDQTVIACMGIHLGLRFGFDGTITVDNKKSTSLSGFTACIMEKGGVKQGAPALASASAKDITLNLMKSISQSSSASELGASATGSDAYTACAVSEEVQSDVKEFCKQILPGGPKKMLCTKEFDSMCEECFQESKDIEVCVGDMLVRFHSEFHAQFPLGWLEALVSTMKHAAAAGKTHTGSAGSAASASSLLTADSLGAKQVQQMALVRSTTLV